MGVNRLKGGQSVSGRFRDVVKLFTLPASVPKYFGYSSCSLITIQTTLTGLHSIEYKFIVLFTVNL